MTKIEALQERLACAERLLAYAIEDKRDARIIAERKQAVELARLNLKFA
ncbi:hypothetical protein J2J97_32165 (plasmid) [Rhizobium bangladeshense]|nr:hypothetical protein [Rhizobium bangladeshense]QSY98561.1 hypothetical protein J2J97_32165 [Rhizobium bangladeshense]